MDNHHRKPDPGDFASYLQSIVQLDALEKMTETLDSDLADSQKVMLDIKNIFDSIHTSDTVYPQNVVQESQVKYENITDFVDAEPPNLLLPDMIQNNTYVDLDQIISSMKAYAEDMKKNLVEIQPQLTKNKTQPINSLDLEHYASSLDQLNKRLANIKLNKTEEFNNRNPDLEVKLTQLCEDVNMFTQMVQAKTTLSESNRKWLETQHNSNALYYDNNINKLLSGINEVSYLLHK